MRWPSSRPDGRGAIFYNAVNGERMRSLTLGGRRVGRLLAGTRRPPAGRGRVSRNPPRDRGSMPPLLSSPLGAPPERRPSEVTLWNPDQPDAPLATLAQIEVGPGRTRPLVAISPDGATVAVASSRETVVSLFDGKTGKLHDTIETQTELTALALGADHQLATAGGGEVRLWDVDTGAALPSLATSTNLIRHLRFSPRGELLAVVGQFGSEVELWDTAAHAAVAVLPTPDRVEDVAFSPDGATIAAVSQGTTTLLWRLVESDVRRRLGGFDTTTRALGFRADGLLALGSWKGSVRFWCTDRCAQPIAATTRSDATDFDDLDEPPVPEGPASLAFDDLGRLVTLDHDSLRVWNDPPRCPDGATRVPWPDVFPNGPGAGLGSGGPGPGRMPWLTLAPARRQAHGRSAQRPTVPLAFERCNDSHEELPTRTDPISAPALASASVPTADQAPAAPGAAADSWAGNPSSSQRPATACSCSTHGSTLDAEHRRATPLVRDRYRGPRCRPTRRVWPSVPTATRWPLARAGVVALINTATGALVQRLQPPPGESQPWVSTLAFAPDNFSLAVGTQQGQTPVVVALVPDRRAPSPSRPSRRRLGPFLCSRRPPSRRRRQRQNRRRLGFLPPPRRPQPAWLGTLRHGRSISHFPGGYTIGFPPLRRETATPVPASRTMADSTASNRQSRSSG